MMGQIIRADARAIPLADASVQCVVTSPPYFGLRDYGVTGQIGLEPTPTPNAFQGWADVFLTTPADGVRGLNAALTWTDETPPIGRALSLTARAHDFSSDDGDTGFGTEIDSSPICALTNVGRSRPRRPISMETTRGSRIATRFGLQSS